MKSGFPRVLARLCSATLLLGAIGYLQTVIAEKELLFCFRGYIALAIGAAVGLLAARHPTSASRVCLGSTALLFGYLVTRSLASPDLYVARFDLYLLLAALTVYASAAFVFTTSNQRIGFLTALLCFGIVHVVFSVVQAHVAENLALIFPSLADLEYRERGAGLYINPDHLAGFLEVIGVLGLSIATWSRWPNWSRVTIGYLAGVVYLGLALTGSRGGYLSALLSLLCFLVLSLFVLRSAGKYRAAKFGGVGLLVLFAGATATWTFIQHNPKLRDRAAQIVTPDRGRYDLWQPAIKQWQLNPIFGTGSGTYAFYGRQFRSPAMEMDPGDVHNDYLNLLCDYGLVGAAAFALFLVVHVRAGLRTVVELGPRRISGGTLLRSDRLALSIGALSAAAGFALHSVVDFNLHVPPNALVLAFVFGIFANTTLGTSREKERTSVILPIVAAGAAILLLVQSARLLPGEYYAEEARVALRDEYPKKAIRLAETALQHERKNPKIFFYLGRAWRALGNLNSTDDADRIPYYERALAAFDQARQLSPLDGTYPLDMAMLYDKMGRFSEAEWMYGVALARDPLSLTATNMYQLHLDEWQNAGTATTR